MQSKDSEINATPLCLGKVSNDFSLDNIKKTGLYVYYMSMIFQLIMIVLMLMIFLMFINI